MTGYRSVIRAKKGRLAPPIMGEEKIYITIIAGHRKYMQSLSINNMSAAF
jgi:hypothetical protein